VTTLYKKEIMAVSIDTVYQRVLSIANKEQRGYITPQEFNLLANQAQLEIFEQYFYDLNQFVRLSGNDTRHADMVTTLEEKISLFEKTSDIAGTENPTGTIATMVLPTDLYKLSTILYKGVEAEKVTQKDLLYIKKSPLTHPTADRPIFTRDNDSIDVYYDGTFAKTTTAADVDVHYIKKPAAVEWSYILGSNNEALFLADDKADFELHVSEETNLVTKILELAGVVIKQPDLYQIADKEEIQTIQQEKQ
tara:strand:+ start:28 stop:777 length:750 start_codon:yes stop_codon:yes gene_type:complete